MPDDRSHSSGDNKDDSDEEEEGGFYVPTAIMAKVASAEKPKVSKGKKGLPMKG
jgi:hypothetical protein